MNEIAKTYVRHGVQWFFVSTINRDSSAPEHVGQYAETMVWEYDYPTQVRGKCIFQGDAAKDSIFLHQKTVENLYYKGTPE